MMHKAARIMPGVSNFLINCRDNDDGGGGNDEEMMSLLFSHKAAQHLRDQAGY